MLDAGGGQDGVAGAEGDGFVAEDGFELALDDDHRFLGVGVDVSGDGGAGGDFEVADPEGLGALFGADQGGAGDSGVAFAGFGVGPF